MDSYAIMHMCTARELNIRSYIYCSRSSAKAAGPPHTNCKFRIELIIDKHSCYNCAQENGGTSAVGPGPSHVHQLTQLVTGSAHRPPFGGYINPLSHLTCSLSLVLGHVLSPVRFLPRHSLLLIANNTSVYLAYLRVCRIFGNPFYQ